VNFGNGENGYWMFAVGSSGLADLSTYRDMSLKFDLKMSQELVDVGLNWSASCLYPCTIGEQSLDLTNYSADAWASFEFSLMELESLGLDLTSIFTPLVLYPPWDLQSGQSFEVSNVRIDP